MNINELPRELRTLVYEFLTPEDISSCSQVCSLWRGETSLESLWRNFLLDMPLGCDVDANYQNRFLEQHDFKKIFEKGKPERKIYQINNSEGDHHIRSSAFLDTVTLVFMITVSPMNTQIFKHNLVTKETKKIGTAPCTGYQLITDGNHILIQSIFGPLYLKSLDEQRGFHDLPVEVSNQELSVEQPPIKIGNGMIACCYIQDPIPSRDYESALQIYDIESGVLQRKDFGDCLFRDICILDDQRILVSVSRGDITEVVLVDRETLEVEVLITELFRQGTTMIKLDENTFIYTSQVGLSVKIYDLEERRVKKIIRVMSQPSEMELISPTRLSCVGYKGGKYRTMIVDLAKDKVLCERETLLLNESGVRIRLNLKKGVIVYDMNNMPQKIHRVIMDDFMPQVSE